MKSVKSTTGNSSQFKNYNEQLHREAKLKREKTSKTINDLKNYIEQHQNEDYLIVGFNKHEHNPWKEKSSCDLI